MRRRAFVATAAGLGTTLLAGCSGDGGGGGGGDGDGGGSTDGDGGGGGGSRGSFRLLISDQPAAIGDFDSLNVTLASARVFRADEDEEITPTAVNGTEAGSDGSPSNETMADEDGDDGDDEEDGEDEDGDGFVEFDLDSATVDLTQVVGDRAVTVLEGELEAGRYSGIELSVAGTEGVVDGEPVEVKVPSGRLRIVRAFEVAADEELNFVFDINVVQRGPGGSYNLLPVIGKSGVAGDDVDVEEVDGDAEDDGDDGADGDGGDDEPADGNGGPPDEAGN